MRRKQYCHFCASRLEEKRFQSRARLYCPECKQLVYENPIPAVCLIVVDGDNRLLLVKRNVEPYAGAWCLPGGFIELGEQPEQAALRELKEETGLSGRISRSLGAIAQHSEQYETVLILGFLVTEAQGEPRAGDDASEIAFFSSTELPPVPFESQRRFIADYYSDLE